MSRRAQTTAALVAAVFLFLLICMAVTLPPQPRTTAGDFDDDLRRRTVAGAFHVHTTRSDGTADADAIAAAAARAGLQFVVLTDHGDGTRTPDPAGYRHDVLVLDGVEVSTRGGHYVAVGTPAAPYPLGGDADAVVEDVRRLGGFGVAAHPDSGKAELRWSGEAAVIDGIEWLNLDSEWRDEPGLALARVVLDYPMRPGPALARILDRPARALEQWRAATSHRPVVALGAHDAHGGVTEGGARGARALIALPSYEASFRTFAVRAVLDAPLSGNATADGESLLRALKQGSVFTAIDAVAAPALLEYRVDVGGQPIGMGGSAPYAADARAHVRASLPPDAQLLLIRDGDAVLESAAPIDAPLASPGVYHVEVRVPGLRVPWLLSNPIYLRAPDTEVPLDSPRYVPSAALDAEARIEKDAASNATVTAFTRGFEVAYRLGQGARASQYVAAAVSLATPFHAAAVIFDGRASRPMRVSVQLRFNAHGGARWGRSVYLSPETRQVAVPLASLIPLDTSAPLPDPASASSLLFVVDLTNAVPGQSGSFVISNPAVASGH